MRKLTIRHKRANAGKKRGQGIPVAAFKRYQ